VLPLAAAAMPGVTAMGAPGRLVQGAVVEAVVVHVEMCILT
jgi:hypothetical protein